MPSGFLLCGLKFQTEWNMVKKMVMTSRIAHQHRGILKAEEFSLTTDCDD